MVPRDEKVNCVERVGKGWARGKWTTVSQALKKHWAESVLNTWVSLKTILLLAATIGQKHAPNMLDARGLKKNQAESLPDGGPEPHRGERWSKKFQCPLLTKPGGAGAQGKGAAGVRHPLNLASLIALTSCKCVPWLSDVKT